MVESAGASPQSGLAVAIINRALIRLTQHVIGLSDRLEFLLGFLRPVVAIGVIRHRQLAIRSLYFCIAGVP